MKDAELAEALSIADNEADDTGAGELDTIDVGRIIRIIVTAGIIIGAAAAVLVIWEAWDENRRIALETSAATAAAQPASAGEASTVNHPPPSSFVDPGPVPDEPPWTGTPDPPLAD
jgi:hypothetical protein